jgi:uncharacterized protein YndB with AHSA1/START domain
MNRALRISASGEHEIRMTRDFDAPRRLVFEAYTKPELLKRWLGVREGWVLAECEVDLRVGGAYRYLWRHEARGARMGAGGRFREIVVPERIVCTEKFDDPWYEGEGLNTASFEERAGKTTLVVTLRYESNETRDRVLRSPMERGVSDSYDALAALLESSSSSNAGSLKPAG